MTAPDLVLHGGNVITLDRGSHRAEAVAVRDGRIVDGDTHRQHGPSGLSREEALRLGTQTGHWVTWNEDRYGSIEPGKTADFVVLDGDPLTCPLDDLKDLPVDMTIVGGAVVFERGASDSP